MWSAQKNNKKEKKNDVKGAAKAEAGKRKLLFY